MSTGKLIAWRAPLIWLGGFALFAMFITVNKGFDAFLQYFILGLPQGAIIALIAVGYSMVYGIIQLINFAHGEVFMLSTYFLLMFIAPPDPSMKFGFHAIGMAVTIMAACVFWLLSGRIFRKRQFLRIAFSAILGMFVGYGVFALLPRDPAAARLPFFEAYALAIILSCCLGVAMDLLAYRPLRNSPRLIPLITAIGMSLFLQNLAQAIWGSKSTDFPTAAKPAIFSGKRIILSEAHNLSMSRLDATVIVFALVLMVALQLFILKTRMGKAMRACAQDRTTAALMGIDVNRVVAFTFALGAGLAALVAPLYVLRGTFIYPQLGYIVGILAFSSAVLGGIGNVTGGMLGGLIIGIIYSFVPLFDALDTFKWFGSAEKMGWITREGFNDFSSNFGRPGQYTLGVAYAFMILIIIFKPTGLLGRASAKRA